MKKLLSIGAMLAVVVFVGQTCQTSTDTSTATTTTTNTATVEDTTTAPADVMTYAVGDDAPAGDITHTVISVETMDEIPESATLEEWEIISESLPADDGFQWLHIMGQVTNGTNESQSIDSTSVVVVDTSGNEFKVSTDTTIYIEDDLSPVYIEIQPTQTKDWEGYFLVPVDGGPFQLLGNDLSFLPEDEVLIDLGV